MYRFGSGLVVGRVCMLRSPAAPCHASVSRLPADASLSSDKKKTSTSWCLVERPEPWALYQVIGEIGYQLVALPSLLMRPARVQLRVVDVVPGEVVSSMPRLGLVGLGVPAVSLPLLLLGLQVGGGPALRLLQRHGLDAVEEGSKWRTHDGFAAVLALECRRTLRRVLYVLDSCCAELLACVI